MKHPCSYGVHLVVALSLTWYSSVAHCSDKRNFQSVDPPFSGTIFISPNIITPSDPTTFSTISYTGQGTRVMFDRRVNAWSTVQAFLFQCTYHDGFSFEVQVNPEFAHPDSARTQAEKYALVIGRLPAVLRKDVRAVWIHQGVQPFGGGNNSLLIHTGQAVLYETRSILEEVFVHEAAHTSLDAQHARSPGWIAAQIADGRFISSYARDYPDREDIAESFLPWLAVRYRRERLSDSLAQIILSTIPNRIAYFDAQSFNMYPLSRYPTFAEHITAAQPSSFVLMQNYPNPFNTHTTIAFALPSTAFTKLFVFNALGEQVALLVSQTLAPGVHYAQWNASSFPSGLYLYRLQAGSFSETRKLIIVK